MKRVLVTGAAGFIGRHSLAALAERGYDVHAVDLKGVTEGPATWHRADLLDGAQLSRVLDVVRPTHLLHFAWYTFHGKYWTSVENLRWVEASLTLLREFVARGGQRAALAGTCAEYDWRFGYCSEGVTPLAPSSLYGTCKHAFHTMAAAYAAEVGLSLAWGRIFLVYGPKEHPDRFVPSVIRSVLRGEPIRCSHGNQVRDFLHARDVADAFASVLDSEVEGPVNLGSGRAVTIKEVVEKITNLIPHSRSVSVDFGSIPVPTDDPPLLVADVRRLAREVAWTPGYDLDAGLSDTIAHLSSQSHDSPKPAVA